MEQRSPELNELIRTARSAYEEFAVDAKSRQSIEQIFGAIDTSVGTSNVANTKLPVCAYLPKVIASAPKRKVLSDLLDAFVALEPKLGWRRRTTYDLAPEETYLVMTEGMFRQGDGNWFVPGAGGSFHNVPMIKHAMRSGEKPLLAFWALWMG